jgi:flavin reductase (DIM6/NTAB) family NADH-FMN oxidoreductase RutF
MDFRVVHDNAGLNQALFSVTHGLYILTANRGKPNGQCIDSLMQVTNIPPRIAMCIGKKSLTYEMIAETGQFAVNAIDHEDSAWMEEVKHFGFQSGRNVDKFADYPYELGKNGSPILPNAKAFYECTVVPEMSVDMETHMLYVSAVDLAGTREGGKPLTYNEYRSVKFKGG